MSAVSHAYLQHATRLAERGVVFVTVTLVHPEGHVPQDLGAKAIVTAEGLSWGTVGGGRLEARAIEHARGLIARAANASDAPRPVAPELIRYELQRDLNMVCGGAATLFYEMSSASTWNIVVFGAGHVAQATVSLLSTFHCNLVCIDPRPEWLGRLPTHGNLRTRLAPEPAEEVDALPPGAYVLCMTQGHATDLPIVRRLLQRGTAGFIGVIGSEPKARTLRSTLRSEGVSEAALSTIRCPLGLPIGSNMPAEIAVSIAAQLLQVRDGRATGTSASLA
ncbi:MAG: xanthine dehydrogenase accessory protein XdhC [Planctomycetota bacterium]|jgi:xanthine dehydrogenase accessory factor|nr:xanthine dehydrogenase accessory protein XdhC [Planctomycetota bacterium]